ncbi:hypothetical protein DFQ30_010571, partial [Apophysomyces sp. BC1015]
MLVQDSHDLLHKQQEARRRRSIWKPGFLLTNKLALLEATYMTRQESEVATTKDT